VPRLLSSSDQAELVALDASHSSHTDPEPPEQPAYLGARPVLETSTTALRTTDFWRLRWGDDGNPMGSSPGIFTME